MNTRMNTKLIKQCMITVVIVLSAACASSLEPATANPREIVSNFEAALNAGDADAAAALFADDAVVTFAPDDISSGAEAIREWVEMLVSLNFEIEYEYQDETDEQVLARTTSYSDWSRNLGVAPLIADEVYTVKDGKIVDLTVTITEESEQKLQAAMAALPSSVVMAFEAALNAGDADAAAALFADDAVVTFAPDDVTSGAEAIREWVAMLVALNFEIEYDYQDETDEQVNARTTSYSDWSRNLGIAPLISDEVYTVKDGKIVDLTVTITEESDQKLQAAMAALPSSVVMAFEAALNAGDVEAATALFVDDAVVTFTPDDVTSGAEAIREWVAMLVSLNFEIEYDYQDETDEQVNARTTSYSDWSRNLGVAPLIADEVYTVKDGKIVDLTVTITEESEQKIAAALQAQPSGVILALEEAINTGDLEGAAEMYGESLYFEFKPALEPGFPNVSGSKSDIRAMLENMISDNVQLEVEILSEEGDTATTKCNISSDYLESLGVSPTAVTEVIRVQDGMIQSHLTSLNRDSLNTLQKGLANSDLPETIEVQPGEEMISAVDDLMGKWLGYMSDEPGYILFEDGGKFKITAVDGQVGERGRYWFEGTVLMMETELTEFYCDKGYASYVVFSDSSSSNPDQLRFVKILDLCPFRSWFMTESPMTFEN